VSGGEANTAFGDAWATVGGGHQNTARGRGATVSGGEENVARNRSSTVGGGAQNTASGRNATVPGGHSNTASGAYSFAAGRKATANESGTVVFGDATDNEMQSEGSNGVYSQMPMYAPSFNTTSARAKKQSVSPVSPESVLDGVTDLEVSTWEFTDTDDGRHMGPMAGAFAEAFELGDDDESIASVDADGVALAAIQGLADRLESKDDRIDELESENEALRARLDDLDARLDAVESGDGRAAED
jgi:hypothetical protein